MADIGDVKVINVHSHIGGLAAGGTVDEEKIQKRIEHYSRPWVIRTWAFGPVDVVIKAQEMAPKDISAFPFMRLGEVRLDDFKKARDRGAVGFKFSVARNRLPYDDPRFWPIYERLQEWKLPVLFHTGYGGHRPGVPQPNVRCMSMHPFTLDTICRNFDELRVVGAHLGQPWCNDACVLSWKHPHLYWDLSGGTVRFKPASFWKRVTATSAEPELRSFEEKVDMEIVKKWMWGTDNPSPDIYRVFYDNLMKLLDVPRGIVEAVYYKNAAEAMNLKEEEF